MALLCLLLIWLMGVVEIGRGVKVTKSEEEGRKFLEKYYKGLLVKRFQAADAEFASVTDLKNDQKNKKAMEANMVLSKYEKDNWKKLKDIPWKKFQSKFLRRQFEKLADIGVSALPEDKLQQLETLKSDMQKIYSTARVCPYQDNGHKTNCNLTLNPDLEEIMAKSQDYDVLAHAWTVWRNATGKKMKKKYSEYIQLMNEAAKVNGYSDAGAMWRGSFESKDFHHQVEKLWQQIRPFYQHLHAYVRRRLINMYGSDAVQEDGPIPAHLLGDMWAQSWRDVQEFTMPFPEIPSDDATPKMLEKKMTPLEMFKIADEFFTSLGLKPMTPTFWKKSIMVKPKDREVVCHASAWDFFKSGDYRIKMCTNVNMKDLITVHHEMGHIQYYMQYADQPPPFREGANPGFHEAIGDTLALSVATPQHLKKIGLLDDVIQTEEADINYLYTMALTKVAFLPFGYLIDLWRWNLFKTNAQPETFNRSWWLLRLKYQGVCPPTNRTDEDFDAGSKYHVPAGTPYLRYFVAHIIQFQFHKALCHKAGHKGPLHTCDVYKSKEAGKIFERMLQEGSRLPWPEAMKILTGRRSMSAIPLLQYFAPLLDWLIKQNRGHTVGWLSTDPMNCPRRPSVMRFFQPVFH